MSGKGDSAINGTYINTNSIHSPNAKNQTINITGQIAYAVNVYYTPILIFLGTIGNLVSVFVFYTSQLRLQSTSQYLSALALSDTVFLFQLLPPWFNTVRLTGLFYQPGFCQVFIYLSYVSSCLSAWLVVAFTFERFVAVLYPLQRNAVWSVKRARHIIGCISLATLVLNTPVLFFAKSTKTDCNINHTYMEHAARFNWVDTIISFTIPLLVIILLNAWIMTGVYRLERARRQLLKEAPQNRYGRPVRVLNCPRSQQRVTRMLLFVSSVFVVLNLPAYTMRLIAYAYDTTSTEANEFWDALQQLALSFFNTNFGINFVLYCLSGQNFRRALRQAIPWLRRRARRGVALRRPISFTHPARANSISTSCVSTCTDTTNNVVVQNVSHGRRRRRDEDAVICRWTFDNSQQRRSAPPPPDDDHYEMPTYRTTVM